MKKLFLVALAVTGIFLAQCTSKKATTKAPATVASGEVKKKYADADVAEGKMIFGEKCGKCHKLFAPTDFPVAKWDNILPKMILKARLDEAQGARVHAYVYSNING